LIPRKVKYLISVPMVNTKIGTF